MIAATKKPKTPCPWKQQEGETTRQFAARIFGLSGTLNDGNATIVQCSLPAEEAAEQRRSLSELGIEVIAIEGDGMTTRFTYRIPQGLALAPQASSSTKR